VGVVAPLARLAWLNPSLILGRTGQVSILNSAVHHGDFWGTLLGHTGQAMGMFLGQGDMILRHNPASRPIFDFFMAIPFLLGVGWCLWQWRRPAAMAALLWVGVMLGPTILAEDTPHFLRAAGILPAVVLFPAIGLAGIWELGNAAGKKSPHLPIPVFFLWFIRPLVLLLAIGSLVMTVRDYGAYSRSPDVAYLFEKAAVEMAVEINREGAETAVFVDNRFWSGWPSIPFLVDKHPIITFEPEQGVLQQPTLPFALYAWPYGPLDFVPQAIPASALVLVESGSLARGDLEPKPYPLYVRYSVQTAPTDWPMLANFEDQLQLRQVQVAESDHAACLSFCLKVNLYWSVETAVSQDITVFVHVLGPDGILIGQHDGPPVEGHWPLPWWRPGLVVQDFHQVELAEPYNPTSHHLLVGLYWQDGTRLQVFDEAGQPVGDSWRVRE
jgi:hypothetical protein